MECVLSIVDCGARIDALVATASGSVVGYATVAGTSNPRFIERHGLRRKLEKLVAGASRSVDDGSCLSVTTALLAPPAEVAGLVAELVPVDRERVLSVPYERCALVGSLGEVDPRSAIVIRADVHSRGWGVDARGQEAYCGGFGDGLGDEGSAYWIGSRGATAALRALERRARNTLLRDRFEQRFGAELGEQWAARLREAWAEPILDRFALARFAEDVVAAAREGDDLAVEILDEAGRDLAVLVMALVNRLELLDRPFSVLPSGAVFRLRGHCLEAFVKALKTKTTKANLVREGMGATGGGALLAVRHLGVKVRPEAAELLRVSLDGREPEPVA